MTAMALQVNGCAVRTAAAPDTPLLYVLRNDLDLRRTRFGCGQGLCGACMVEVDGRWALSCDTPLWSLEGKAVRTAEGLEGDRAYEALRECFLERQAAQCGYCSTGLLVRATLLLKEQPRATRADIAVALERNLCRCGAHQRVLDAIEAARDRLSGAA
jgi:nicotinate dehydrogenase subunit A